MQRRHHFGQNPQQNNDEALSDPSSKPEVQEALKWLAQASIHKVPSYTLKCTLTVYCDTCRSAIGSLSLPGTA
jgi:hypothetical protein